MADESKTLILDVRLPADEALRTLAELNLRSAQLRKEQKELGPVTKENAEEYTRLGAQIKAINSQASQYQRQIQNNIKLQNAQEASLEKLRIQLALDNAEFAKLGNTQEEIARKAVLGKQIAETTENLKQQEAALGNFTRNVGNYESATVNLRTELKELTNQLVNLAAQGDKNSEQYRELRARAEDLKTAIGDVNQEIQRGSSNTATLDTITQSAQGVVAAFTLWKSASAAVGAQNEDLDKILKQVLISMAALNALTQIQNTLYKTSNTYRAAANLLQKIGINQTKAETAALAAKNKVMTANTVVTKLAAAATWLWNAALSANPVIIITVALIAATAAVVGLTAAFSSGTKAQETYEETTKRVDRELKNLNNTLKDSLDQLDLVTAAEIELAKQQKKSITEIAKIRYDAFVQRVKLENASYANSNILILQQIRALQREISARKLSIAYLGETSRQGRKAAQELKTLNDTYNELTRSIGENNRAIQRNNLALITSFRELGETIKKDTKTQAEKALKILVDASNSRQKILEEQLKLQRIGLSNNLVRQQQYESSLFEIQQQGESERLDAQRKYGAITQKQYEDSLKLLELKSEQFYTNQMASANTYFQNLRESIIKQAGQTTEQQVAEVITKYRKAIQDLDKVQAPVRLPGMSDEEFQKALSDYEKFLYERAEIELRLTKEQEREIQKIRDDALAKRVAEIDKALQKEYAEDLAKFADNENEKLRVEREYLEKRIQQYKEAGKETYDLEAELRANNLRQIGVDLNRELLLADKNSKSRYQAKKKALEAELELQQDNADRQLEISKELADLQEEFFNDQFELIEKYAQNIGNIFSQLTELVNTQSDRQLQKVQEQYKEEELALARKYSLGLLNEAQYNEESLKLEKRRAEDEAKIERDKAKRERDNKIFTVITDTAMGVAKAIAASPTTFGLPWSAFMATQGALQLATIRNEPLPKAARGMYIEGPSHSGGGVNINAEGGEAIINRRSTSMFLPLLSAINQLGGGVPFASVGSDGGFASRYASEKAQDNSELVNNLHEAISQIKIYTAISDIRRGEQLYSDIESSGSLFNGIG